MFYTLQSAGITQYPVTLWFAGTQSTKIWTHRKSQPNKKNHHLHAEKCTEQLNTILHPSFPSSLSPCFSSHDTNACSSCLAPWIHHKEKMYLFCHQEAHPTSPVLICLSGDGSDTQTDGIRCCTHVILSVFSRLSHCCFLSLSWPLVYWHHQLNTTSSYIYSTNDCVVKSINLQSEQKPREMLRNKTVKTKL